MLSRLRSLDGLKMNWTRLNILTAACATFLILTAGQANAGSILSATACGASSVTAGGNPANLFPECYGIFDRTSSGPGPNDSATLLNNAFLDGFGGWGESGAFGLTGWSQLGKDEGSGSFITITGTSGAITWATGSTLLDQPYAIAIKQGTQLGIWGFSSLPGVQSGEINLDAAGGWNGWSHISLYTTSSSIPCEVGQCFNVSEPGALVILGTGLLGMALSRRRLRLSRS